MCKFHMLIVRTPRTLLYSQGSSRYFMGVVANFSVTIRIFSFIARLFYGEITRTLILVFKTSVAKLTCRTSRSKSCFATTVCASCKFRFLSWIVKFRAAHHGAEFFISVFARIKVLVTKTAFIANCWSNLFRSP